MRGVDQIDVVHALIDQFKIDIAQAIYRNIRAVAVVRKIEILAKAAFQAASGKEYRAAAASSGNHRFFIIVRRRARDTHARAHAAYAAARFAARGIAHSGTQIADKFLHFNALNIVSRET